jgi:dihydrofolate reductase
MPKLIYIANTSLDGYVEDYEGNFNWTEPSDEVFAFITDLIRPAGTSLYGRRMYETMAVWETDPSFAAQSDLMGDFAQVWQDSDKVVYSTTLQDVSTGRTRIEREFEPDAVRELKASASSDLTIGGATLAALALRAGVVDECHLLLYPVSIGGGKSALPRDVRVDLELIDERRFSDGVVYVRHRVLS